MNNIRFATVENVFSVNFYTSEKFREIRYPQFISFLFWNSRVLTQSAQLSNEIIQTVLTMLLLWLRFSGPDDVLINHTANGLYQQSVTLTARMWPPIEAGPPKTFLGLPAVIWWGVLFGCFIILLLTLASFFLCCWLLPRRREKILSPIGISSEGATISSNGNVLHKYIAT